MSQRTLEFAQAVVATATGESLAYVQHVCREYETGVLEPSTDASGNPQTGFDPATIVALIQAAIKAIMDLINNCPQRSRRGDLVSTIRSPGLFQKALVRRTVSKACRDCCVNDSDIRGYTSALTEALFAHTQGMPAGEMQMVFSEVMED